MPSPRAVLHDLLKNGLDPKVPHRTLQNGRIVARTADAVATDQEPAPLPKPGSAKSVMSGHVHAQVVEAAAPEAEHAAEPEAAKKPKPAKKPAKKDEPEEPPVS